MNPTPSPTGADLSAPSLSEVAIEHLGKARFWARLIAFFGFGYTGLMVIGTLFLVLAPTGMGGPEKALLFVPLLLGIGYLLLSSVLTWGYARHLRAHARGQGAALAAAFRSLRHIWILLTISYGLSIAATVIMTVAKLLGYEGPGAPGTITPPGP